MIYNIHSYENSKIKHLKQLAKKKYRDQYGEYTIEGTRIVQDALKHNKKIKWVLFSASFANSSMGQALLKVLEEKNINAYIIPDKMFEELADTQNPQGILAILSYEKYDLYSILNETKGLILVLDRIQDPGNLGTIIRTADAAGVDAILLSKECVDLYNLKTIRSTMGSIFNIPILSLGATKDIISILKEKAYEIISTSLETDKNYYDIDFSNKKALIIGNEGNGVLPEAIQASDYVIKIPILGKAESLNAAVAASILIYEAVRQKYSLKI